MSFLRFRIGLLAVTLLSLVWGFQDLIFEHAPTAFASSEEDMSFAWYVPLFSLYVVWTERRQIAESIGAPGWGGFVASIPLILLGFMGVRGSQMRFEVVAFAGLLVTVPWAVFGRETAKRMLFPAGYLLFCIPLATFLDIVTVHLRLFATATAYGILSGLGVDIVRRGTALLLADGSFGIDVAAPCSGLRSIFALMALTAGYAYFTQKTWLKRGVLFALSVPIAVAGNVMRVLSIVLVAKVCDPDFAMGFYHDYSGYVVFVVAIALMVGSGEALKRVRGAVGGRGATALPTGEGGGGRDGVPSPSAERRVGMAVGEVGGGHVGRALAPRAPHWSIALPCAVAVLVVAAMAVLATTPEVTLAEAPKVSLGEIAGYTSESFGPSEQELNVLPKDTVFHKRHYSAADGRWFRVNVVIGGKSKSSIHRPELCLPSQGFLMVNPHTIEAGGLDWRALRLAGNGQRPDHAFAYTFFNQAGYQTSSHVKRIFRDVCDRSFLNRIDRWVMVTVSASQSDEKALAVFLEHVVDQLKGAMK